MTLRLSPYYLNTRRLETLSCEIFPQAAQHSIVNNSGERAAAMKAAGRSANGLLQAGLFPSLTREIALSSRHGERVLAALWGVFTFRGLPAAIEQERLGKNVKVATFSGAIPLGDSEYSLSGKVFNDHLYSVSSDTVLTGRRRMFVAGQFAFNGSNIEAFPFIIGDMLPSVDGAFVSSYAQSVRVFPGQIDQFQQTRDQERVNQADLKALRQIPEENIKRFFADIINEPFVPKDWGGEKSDLTTSRLTLQGQELTAAFIFKGPSVSGELHPANMGKRGDQLVRAFDEPVGLIVIQHCNKIANSVVRIAEAMSFDPRRPRRYCVVDGADTVRLLRAYGHFGRGSSNELVSQAAADLT